MDQKQMVAVPTLAQEVYSRLRENIMNGDFSPGEKISIRKIAERYAVSTMPVREALNKLQSEGFVHFERRSIYVSQLSSKDLIEIFKIRMNLEEMAMEWSYPNIGENELIELTKLVKEMDDKIDSPIEWNVLNKQFHTKIYSYSHSKPMLEILNAVWGRVEPYMNIYAASAYHLSLSQKEHGQMIEYMAKKEWDRLQALTSDHIQKTCHAILEKLP
ncbi:GntR family transcriptional regulator [Niallia endozanthoxylica]|uniref:GntR family transcriptional regulator n=1 Tax=Niallia endozanthoxylica TaxID=2036016 RepID=A0A5J5I1V6_9BACI|nr:GntR family transcriptional regulator [Niallia endozanthoxylica]KAA9028575.1 GntR family transcriptional regulator [Niallia endozanthoxylica]